MSRELAGVIACMQEIEIACEALEEMRHLKGYEGAAQIKEKVRAFFVKPSRDTAQEVIDSIRRKSILDLSSAPVTVDNIRTTLSGLSGELAETLADLEEN